jgi:hypothetical protein
MDLKHGGFDLWLKGLKYRNNSSKIIAQRFFMRSLLSLILGVLVTLATTGCGSLMSSKDLGTVVNEIPKVEGADKPYEMPQLVKPSTEEETQEKVPVDK